MRALMVQGASSSAGKSLLVTALARAFRRRGIDVVPFKAQNMSNNARVVHGGEIGTAQYLQALAAGVKPDVRMNPVLVKPEGDNRSQVIVLGQPDLELSRLAWRDRCEALWPVIAESLRSLQAEHELVLLEGAGSPAEINLRDSDLANMRSAEAADAAVVLVCDIDRGGAFAHLYGTWALLGEHERARLSGFVLNKFRGDERLLAPAPERLEELTGVQTLGVLPWLKHGLPDEDGAAQPIHIPGRPRVAVVRYPTASNLDEFKPLEQVAALAWVTSASELADVELLVLPGSKHVAADVAWLRRSGIADAIGARIRPGGRVLAICGGLQMLGEQLVDEAGIDGSAPGIAILPLTTRFHGDKTTRRTISRFAELPEPWSARSGLVFEGYEIRHGESVPTRALSEALPGGLGYVSGSVLGIYLHGLFEHPPLIEPHLGARASSDLEQTFDELADDSEARLALGAPLHAVTGV